MRRALGAVLFWLAVVMLASCAHKYRRTENAYLQESERIKWDATEEKHAEQQQQRGVERRDSAATYRRKTTPSPAGPIVEEEYALTLSELRDISAVVTASNSRSATGGEAEKAKKAESNLNVAADTKAGWSPWWWLLVLIPVAVVVWTLRRWLRSRIPFL